MVDRKWTVRSFHKGDETQLRCLTQTVFNRSCSETHWNWQFAKNPAGHAEITVAVDGDHIVGQYAVVPVNLKVDDKMVHATLSMDTMTHPDYRRQGVFTVLAESLYATLSNNGTLITYGFPNENSLGGFVRKLGWTEIGTIPMFFRPLKMTGLAASLTCNKAGRKVLEFVSKAGWQVAKRLLICKAAPMPPNMKVSQVCEFDKRMDYFWEQASVGRKIAVVRNHHYLNWRFMNSPERLYKGYLVEQDGKVIAYMVTRIMNKTELKIETDLKGGMIADFMALPEYTDAIQWLLAVAIDDFKKEDVDFAACLINGDIQYQRYLKKTGFIRIPESISKKRWHFGARVHNGLDVNYVYSLDNWYLTFGDNDVI